MSELNSRLVHIFSFNGEYFAVDVNSGSLMKIDEPSFIFLGEVLRTSSLEEAQVLSRERIPQVDEIRKEFEDLINEGVLFSSEPSYFESELVLKSMCLNIAHACNFACVYCFAKKGSYGGKETVMKFDVAKQAIDFLNVNSKARETLEVDFFGGEPLIAFETVRKTIEYARSSYPDRTWRFTLTTNGSLLDREMEDFLYENDVSLVLSLDGSKSTNDLFRVYSDGTGTFDSVFNKVKLVSDHRRESKGYYVRGTYTHRTLQISRTVMDLFKMGFDFISLEPVVTKEHDIGIEESDLTALRHEYEKLACDFVESQNERRWQFFHFSIDLSQGPCIQKRINGCGAGVEYIAVAPNGDIFPCHQFDGISEMKLGNVFESFTRLDLIEKFRKANFLFNKKECSSCWARFYCSGGCLANNYNMNGDILEPYKIGCEIQKMRIEAALYVQYKLMEMGIEPVPTEDLRY